VMRESRVNPTQSILSESAQELYRELLVGLRRVHPEWFEAYFAHLRSHPDCQTEGRHTSPNE
jgi:hypothetical protein